MAMNDPDENLSTGGLDLFTEPSDYYPPSPTPTTGTHTLLSGQILTVRLVGHNPLWGHHLWNAGRLVSTYLGRKPGLIKDRTVLELGAGAGLPSLVCAGLGARKVVVTDYPDPDLVENLRRNVDGFFGGKSERKGEGEVEGEKRNLVAEGYCWGGDVTPLLSHLPAPNPNPNSPPPPPQDPGFEVLILADLLFNHSEHGKLVSTIEKTLMKSADAKALVFFTPYRPWLYEKDMAFFEMVRERGFLVEKVLEEKMEKVMFVEDRGDEELRRTVFGYVVRWKELAGWEQRVGGTDLENKQRERLVEASVVA